MIKCKSDLRFYISEDRKRNLRTRPDAGRLKYFLMKLYKNENIMACDYLKCLRKYEYAINCRKGIDGVISRAYYRWKHRRLSFKYNLLIYPNMVGYGLILSHFRIGGGIVINCNSMGNYCIANSGVMLGNKNSRENRPSVGDNVEFCAGAKVFGALNIGSNSIIAPNSVVIKDVPENSIVSGVPAKLIKLDGQKVQ